MSAPKPLSLFTEEYAAKMRPVYLNPLKGQLDVAASARICNRCGACNRRCPSYKALLGEVYSPRGRNQLLYFLTQRKFDTAVNRAALLEPALTCLQCGQCASACAAYAPADKHCADIKRAFNFNTTGPVKRLLLNLAVKYPGAYYALKNIRVKSPRGQLTDAFYMPSAQSAKYARASLKIIAAGGDGVAIIKSGLPLAQAALRGPLTTVKKALDNILKEYQSVLSSDPLPLITDDIETYRALKSAGELGQKYEPLAQSALFITACVKPQKAAQEGKKILVQNNNILFCADKVLKETLDILICRYGDFFVELGEDVHSAGLMAYCAVKAQPEIECRLAAEIAAHKADVLVTLSAREEKFLKKLLKTYYPRTKVVHITSCLEFAYGQ